MSAHWLYCSSEVWNLFELKVSVVSHDLEKRVTALSPQKGWEVMMPLSNNASEAISTVSAQTLV